MHIITQFYDRSLDLVIQPQRTFARVAEHPRLLPGVLFLVLATLAMTIVLSPMIVARMLTMAQELEIVGIERMVSLVTILGVVFAIVQTVLSLVMGALVMHGLARLLGGVADVYQTAVVTVIAAIPTGIKALVITAIALIFGPERAPLAMGGMEGPNLLMLLDPFAIWSAVLLGVGLTVVHRLSRGRAFALAFGLMLVGVLLNALSGMGAS